MKYSYILNYINNQVAEDKNYIILPSDLILTVKDFEDIKVLAQEQFPSIPADILDTLNPSNQHVPFHYQK